MGSGELNDAIKHGEIEVNGVRLHYAEQGEGPLVLLLHGFPESWYSWRHQFAPLAEAGYRVVAPDQRGFARSDRPERVDQYSLLHLVGDVTALIGALGEERAVVVGHDWGAPVAWATAALRPDLVRAVAGLSVPPLPVGGPPPLEAARAAFGEGYYQVYFQEPGRADAELAADVRTSLRRILSAKSPDGTPRVWIVPEGQGLLDSLPEPERLPDWLTEADLDAFEADYAPHGEKAFTGGLNWYRNLDRNAELLAAFTGVTVDVPALFVVGEQDLVNAMVPRPVLDHLLSRVPRLHGHVRLPETGHWTQQERPAEVNAALLDFLAHVDK
ncbi:alpha/beta fold hydrolase [Kitasatospora sp. NPDC058063]|uniref:alpha/beta fold hydrolase n=1 Tax=unclassified Kitasatospora TaxID=2633591 RepID=UPI0036DE46E0